MKSRSVYADTPIGRLGAEASPERGQAVVWIVNGGTLGWYNLSRFEGGKLTAGTLKKLFTPEPG